MNQEAKKMAASSVESLHWEECFNIGTVDPEAVEREEEQCKGGEGTLRWDVSVPKPSCH